MPETQTINPVDRPVSGAIRPPGSKSITNRAAICAALANGRTQLTGVLDSEDTRVMVAALQCVDVEVLANWDHHELAIEGTAGRFDRIDASLFVANSGTSIRFLTALASLIPGHVTLDGIERMRERPIGDLVDALGELGVEIRYPSQQGFPPLVVSGDGLIHGGGVGIKGDISSQFLSGLMMVAPYAQTDVDIQVEGTLVSKPYVSMTAEVMNEFGVTATMAPALDRIQVAGSQCYQARTYAIEPDASAASYFLAAAAITGGDVTIEGLGRKSLQGDIRFCDCLEQMGCEVEQTSDATRVIGKPLRGIDVDMNAISDTVQTLAAVALFAEGKTRVRGVAHNRHKETDRIGDLACELRRVGADVKEFEDGLEISPRPLGPVAFNTYNDHRMAMSLALIGLKQPGIVINNPDCTSKTYPKYFADLDRLANN